MTKPKVIIFSGYGVNGEEETKFSFEKGGALADVIHINDVIQNPKLINKYQIVSLPPGFSYGDDTGSGNAYANKLKNHLWEQFQGLLKKDVLILGVCNGFQILVNLGLLPAVGGKYGVRQSALIANDGARLSARWVDVKVLNKTPWLEGLTEFPLPIAHGEGKFFADQKVLDQLKKNGQIALKYVKGEVTTFQGEVPNPNGSLEDIAGVTDPSGKILGLMPHPDRAVLFTQLPHWTFLKEEYKRQGKKLPQEALALQVFKNAVKYFGS